MNISKRLRAIGDLVPDNSFILDIGCDHALLDIYVVKENKNVRAIASDINKGPLQQAKINIQKYKLQDKIKLKQADGLNSIEKETNIVIISGLGSQTIVNILTQGQNKLTNIKKLIISSNNDYYYLRKNIQKLEYKITNEIIIKDKNKYYPIIVFEKGKEKHNKFKLKYGPVLLKNKDKTFIEYLNLNKQKLLKINKSLNKKHIIKKLKINKEIKQINNITTQ